MLKSRRFLLHVLIGGVSALALRVPARAQSLQYTYDALGRLKTVTYPDGRITTYTYDAAGNRSQVTTGSAEPPPPPSPLTVGVSPTSLSGAGMGLTETATTSVSGGTPPFTYLWERLSGSSNIVANDPVGSATNFFWNGSFSGLPKLSSWSCRVTDAASVVAYSPTIQVAFDPAG